MTYVLCVLKLLLLLFSDKPFDLHNRLVGTVLATGVATPFPATKRSPHHVITSSPHQYGAVTRQAQAFCKENKTRPRGIHIPLLGIERGNIFISGDKVTLRALRVDFPNLVVCPYFCRREATAEAHEATAEASCHQHIITPPHSVNETLTKR